MFVNSFADPQIEILAPSPRLDMLMSKLTMLGFRVIRAEQPLSLNGRTPVLIDESAQFDVANIKRPIVWLGKSAPPASVPESRIWLRETSALSELQTRLALRERMQLREIEREMRAETAGGFATPSYASAQRTPAPRRGVLYLGEVDAHFLPIKRELASRGIEMTSAMTATTARSYLDGNAFSVLIVQAEFLRENSVQLGDLLSSDAPYAVLKLSEQGTLEDPVAGMCAGGAMGSMDMVAALVARAPLEARLSDVRLSSQSHDPQSGLYSEAFLRAHLPRQMAVLGEMEIGLSLLGLRLRSEAFPADMQTHAFQALASVALACMRETDLVCRMNTQSLLISLPGTNYGDASRMAKRLCQDIRATQDGAALAEAVLWRVAERREHHSVDALINAAMNGPFARPVAA